MHCPNCNEELTKKKLETIEVDECVSCKGLWFEDDELRQAKDAADADLNWMDFEIWKHQDKFKVSPKNRPCPKCQKPMPVVKYGATGVNIDCCPQCKGVWLDKGEFKKIVKSLQKELLTKSFTDYVIASLGEATEVVAGPESFVSEWKDLCTVLRMMQYRVLASNPALADTITSIQQSNIGMTR